MKQLVLVLLIAATSLSVSAQKDYRDNNRKKDKYDRVDRYKDKHNRREKEEYRRQLERINHDYDSRINAVSRNPWINRKNKARKINELETQRRYALNECRARFHRKMDYAERGKINRRNKW